jgi:hypothetical protein
MKTKLIFSAIIVFTTLVTRAQDMLILKSGEDINAKIVEIGTQEITYRKFENLDGPIYTIPKEKIFMIKYQNGTKETFGSQLNEDAKTEQKKVLNAPPVQEKKSISLNDSQRKLQKGKVLTGIGTSFSTVGAALLISGGVVFGNSVYYSNGRYFYDYIAESNGLIMMSVGGVVLATGLPMMIVGLAKMGAAKKEIRLSKNSAASLQISPTLLPNYSKSGNTPGIYLGLNF